MAALTGAEVDVTMLGQFPVTVPGVVRRQWRILFPNAGAGANVDYTAATGIPLTRARFGYQTALLSMRIVGRTVNAGANLDPYFEWNGSQTAPALMAFEGDSAADNFTQQSVGRALAVATPVSLVVETEGY